LSSVLAGASPIVGLLFLCPCERDQVRWVPMLGIDLSRIERLPREERSLGSANAPR
jgi:hypothetical protein